MHLIRRIGSFAALLLLLNATAQAAASFPALTGRVVDNAHLLSAAQKQTLDTELASFEAQTSDQLVVVTVPSLNGQAIEEYGVALGRQWGIGQKGKDNGVLLIVAPQEHKVRIEVGYGLEGTLTDAVTSQIIQTIIVPAFKQGNMPDGIMQGAQAIISVASGGNVATPAQASADSSSGHFGLIAILILLFLFSQVLLFVLYLAGSILGFILSLFGFNAMRRWLAGMKTRVFPADRALLFWLLMPSGRITGSGGGGFSGGGGSFGGGGSSGSW